jgi:hypothetical protein
MMKSLKVPTSYNETGDPTALTAPETLGRVAAQGPPRYGSWQAEEQQMAIMASLTMPEDHDPVPYSDQFSTDRTFNKYIIQRQQLMWQEQPEDPDMSNIKPSETFVASFRGVGSVWRRFIYHDANAKNLENHIQLQDSEALDSVIYLEDDDTGQLNFNIAVAKSTYKPHGPQMVCGRTLKTKYANASWFWLDGVPEPGNGLESLIYVTFNGAFDIQECSFKIVAWRGGRFVEVDTISFTQAQVDRSSSSSNITQSDYYSIFYQPAIAPDVDDNNFATGRGVTIEASPKLPGSTLPNLPNGAFQSHLPRRLLCDAVHRPAPCLYAF